MKVFVVIPTIRTLTFLREWKDQFSNCHIIIVEDHPTIQIETPTVHSLGVFHYAWKNIASDFGNDEWIFSRKNAGIRSYGFWKAYTSGADIIITLDDDCYPVEDGFVNQHIDNLSAETPERWINTYPHSNFVYTRGIPYSIRKKHRVMISHGLWTNKIDLDGRTEIRYPNLHLPSYPPFRQFVPTGAYFPMCSMNLAFRREATPLMYFPLMGFDPSGRHWGYDRFDDIWAGVFAKKIIDHLDFAVVNGSPFVDHRKASDVRSNIERERKGLEMNESLWKLVDSVKLTKHTLLESYRELAAKISFPKDYYFIKLKKAMILWSTLFILS